MKSEKGGIVAVLLIIIFVVFLIMVFSSGGSGSSTSYNQKATLYDAYEKSNKGQTLTKREKDELDSYRKWEKKTYGNNI